MNICNTFFVSDESLPTLDSALYEDYRQDILLCTGIDISVLEGIREELEGDERNMIITLLQTGKYEDFGQYIRKKNLIYFNCISYTQKISYKKIRFLIIKEPRS